MKRAIFVCCDGLGIDWLTPERTPVSKPWRNKACGAPIIARSSPR